MQVWGSSIATCASLSNACDHAVNHLVRQPADEAVLASIHLAPLVSPFHNLPATLSLAVDISGARRADEETRGVKDHLSSRNRHLLAESARNP